MELLDGTGPPWTSPALPSGRVSTTLTTNANVARRVTFKSRSKMAAGTSGSQRGRFVSWRKSRLVQVVDASMLLKLRLGCNY